VPVPSGLLIDIAVLIVREVWRSRRRRTLPATARTSTRSRSPARRLSPIGRLLHLAAIVAILWLVWREVTRRREALIAARRAVSAPAAPSLAPPATPPAPAPAAPGAPESLEEAPPPATPPLPVPAVPGAPESLEEAPPPAAPPAPAPAAASPPVAPGAPESQEETAPPAAPPAPAPAPPPVAPGAPGSLEEAPPPGSDREGRVADSPTPAAASDDSEAEAQETRNGELIGWCARCREHHPMQCVTYTTNVSGRRIARGVCPVCGAGITRFVAWGQREG
jgi:hypothetical protein